VESLREERRNFWVTKAHCLQWVLEGNGKPKGIPSLTCSLLGGLQGRDPQCPDNAQEPNLLDVLIEGYDEDIFLWSATLTNWTLNQCQKQKILVYIFKKINDKLALGMLQH